MKSQYEDRARFMLPRRTYTIIRLDGKAFHTLTRGLVKPFDDEMAEAMTRAAMAVVAEAQGAKLAYVQSDEISIVLTDFDSITTEAWFDGNVQKIASVSAALASVVFNFRGGVFDARVFTIPDPVEVVNYFIWRQKDAIRNSVQSSAQAKFSAKQLHGKKVAEMLEMLDASDAPWMTMRSRYQRGWSVVRQPRLDAPVERWSWTPDFEVPVFTESREYVGERIAYRLIAPINSEMACWRSRSARAQRISEGHRRSSSAECIPCLRRTAETSRTNSDRSRGNRSGSACIAHRVPRTSR